MSEIAIVGIGCRLPGGVTSPASLWQLLEQRVDAIGPVPPDRWDTEQFYSPKPQPPGRMSAREAGFLDDVRGFDAAFFGISGRIAEQMDPQQRLLLEVTWETLEDAGIVPGALAGGRTGVFIGACSQDYGGLQSSPGELEGLGPHSATGTFMSILSNRLSYTFDLRGPSMTIDTACSSSLVAVHLACESLGRGESELAIAGGVNLMLTPQFAIALSQASMLSPDARSRAFDATANGYVRGEGAGVVVLKPLAAAHRDRDRIYAVIRGSAINQDGRTQGITVPSGAAQEANFRAALAAAGVAPHEVGYIEAHGTGTPVGDPIEAGALGRVVADGRAPEQPAFVGSIKTNVGHLEAGAGIAGLIKAALSVHHRRIAPNLHFEAPNPEIDFEGFRLTVPTEAQPWPDRYPRAIAAVNSFGFGGANANVVLEEPPAQAAAVTAAPAPVVLPLSARSAPALTEAAVALADRLDAQPEDLEHVAANLALRRSHHGHRLAVVAADVPEAVTRLRAFADGAKTQGVHAGKPHRTESGKLAFLFNGQGPQWYAMGRTLLETSPVFRAKVLECDRVARAFVDWSILEELSAPDEAASHVNETYCLQPTMFAVQVALADLWRSWGIVPDGVAGHSMGEIAAAHVSGALPLEAALRVICNRSRIQQGADPTGGMMFVALSREAALELCAAHPGALWLSAENSANASTLSGRRDVLEQVARELDERGVFARLLRVNCACHSPDMDPWQEPLRAELAGIAGTATDIPMYSTVTGARIDGHELDTSYWWQNFRRPVLFAPTIRAMLADGFDTFVELSPHPVLANALQELLAEHGGDVLALSTLARKKDDWQSLLGGVAKLYATGREPAWERRFPGGADALALPTNPWRHEPYWNESESSREYRTGRRAHPMIKPVDGPRPAWEVRWDDHRLAWAFEHDVLGSVIVPGAAYVEAALAAAREATGGPCALEYVEFERACALADEPRLGRLELDRDDGTFAVHHRDVRGDTWARNVRGRFFRAAEAVPPPADLDAIRARCSVTYDAAAVYGALSRKGYAYGPAFCGIAALHTGAGEALARIEVPRTLARRLDGYRFHPALLDACFQAAILHPVDGELLPYTYLPTGIERVRQHASVVAGAVWCHTSVHKLDATGLLVDVTVYDDDGTLLATYERLSGKVVPRTAAADAELVDDHLYRFAWKPDPAARAVRRSALTCAPSELRDQLEPDARALAARLDRRGYASDYQRELRRLCVSYVACCVWNLGGTLRPGGTFAGFLGVQPHYERALAGWLQLLVDDGVLAREGQGFRVLRAPDTDAAERWARLLAAYPACVSELQLLRRTGPHLHEVITGRVDPLELLFPAGAQEEAEAVYQSAPVARFYNSLVKRAVEHLVRTADPRRTLRVLEVGGGTGGLTASVLPVLAPERTEYVFTDVSPAFVQRAQERFGTYEFVTCRLLDAEHDLLDQGIAEGGFDLVLGADVIHATQDLKRTLTNLRSAIAPGGLLTLIEAEPGSPWLDLTFGLTDGWWAFRDLQLRSDGPLLAPGAWTEVLASAGYEDATAIGDPEHSGAGAQAVLLARAPEPAEPPSEPADGGPDPLGDWLVLGADALGEALSGRVEGRGGRAIRVRTGPAFKVTGFDWTVRAGHPEDLDRLLDLVRPEGVIQLPAADACVRLTEVIGALARRGDALWPRVHVLTRGAHAFRNGQVELDGAPAWGFGLVAGLELPDTDCTLIDLEPQPYAREAELVWSELWRADGEREVALRGGERFTRRLVPLPAREIDAPVPASEVAGFTLALETPGALDGLRFHAAERLAPGPGQVEVEVVASGLNFLDVMTALGQVPPLETASGYRFGAECAGIVSRVGDGVEHVRVGDAVVAIVGEQGTLASHVTVDAASVVAKPETLSFEEAAAIPIVFLTASYALSRLARLTAGERVLIHSAAGGTGLAAIQIARRAGAEVLATAGSEEKREFLRALGVECVFDSRSPSFEDDVRAATGGAGVDVVLNAIAGEAASRSLACLAPYGRFVEIGKRDLLSDQRLGLRPFLRNLAYFSFDLRQTLVDRPLEVRFELEALLDGFAAGTLRPLPYRVFHPAQTEAAFRHLAGARHVGKVVVAMDERELRIAPSPRGPRSLTGTWLITGGLGGVGLRMGEALADTGVRRLALVGRSGVKDPARVEALRARGVEVLAEAVDVTSRAALESLLDRIGRDELRGVLHCAMVLDDALITELDAGRLERVFAPKAVAARHLHELTADLNLDAFVLFSSATSMVGNRGQASYAAANAYLDHLAELRRAQGLPALAVNLGAVSDAGYVARHDDVGRMVAATGMRGFTVAQAFAALRALWSGAHAQVGLLPMDWDRFFAHHGFEPATQPRYEALFGEGEGRDGAAAAGGSLRQRLRGEGATTVLSAALKARVATVLGIPPDELDEQMPLMDYLDSLLAVELSAWIEREVGVKLTILELMKGPSVAQLTAQLIAQVEEPAALAVAG